MLVLLLTHVAGSAASGRHYARVLHFRQAKVAYHYFAVLVRAVVQQILRLFKNAKKNQMKKLNRADNCGESISQAQQCALQQKRKKKEKEK